MKIVNRETFLSLPENTIFCKYRTCYFGDIEIKTGNCGENDFISVGLTEITADSDSDFFETCKQMESGKSIPLDPDATSRDGMFDSDQLFCIYEKIDVLEVIKLLMGCVK